MKSIKDSFFQSKGLPTWQGLRTVINFMSGFTPRLIFFAAWLYSFPMYGPILTHTSELAGGSTSQNFISYLLFHAFGLLGFSFLKKIPKTLLTLGVLLLSAFTVCFLYAPNVIMPAIMAIIGVLSSLVMLDIQWQFAYEKNPGDRGKKLGRALFCATALFFPALFWGDTARLSLPFHLWAGLLIIASSMPIFFNIGKASEAMDYSTNKSHDSIPGIGSKHGFFLKDQYCNDFEFSTYWRVLLLLVFGFYFTGGLIYSLVYPQWFTQHTQIIAIFSYSVYMLAALAAGLFAGRFIKRTMISIALCVTGLGYLGMAIFTENFIYIIALCLTQAGAAFMDIFLFVTLANLAAHSLKPYKVIGIGLSVNVFSIFFSNIALIYWSNQLMAATAYKFIAIGVLFLLLPLTEYLKDDGLSIANPSSPYSEPASPDASGISRESAAGFSKASINDIIPNPSGSEADDATKSLNTDDTKKIPSASAILTPMDSFASHVQMDSALKQTYQSGVNQQSIQRLDEFSIKYKLTPRETEIARLLVDGHTLSEIETALGIKKSTVKTHLQKIYNKTDTANSKEFILLVLKNKA